MLESIVGTYSEFYPFWSPRSRRITDSSRDEHLLKEPMSSPNQSHCNLNLFRYCPCVLHSDIFYLRPVGALALRFPCLTHHSHLLYVPVTNMQRRTKFHGSGRARPSKAELIPGVGRRGGVGVSASEMILLSQFRCAFAAGPQKRLLSLPSTFGKNISPWAQETLGIIHTRKRFF